MSDRVDAYAEAIVTVASAEGNLEAVETELLAIARAVDDNAELREALSDRQKPLAARLAFVESDGVTRASRSTRSALALVLAADLGSDLSAIAHEVAERAARARDAELAEVLVARPLDDDQKRRLAQALERQVGRSLDVRFFVDPSVVGGVRAKIGDTVIDGSIAARLQEVRARLT